MDFVLLHGTTQAPEGWSPLITALTGRGHRALTVDFPTDRPELTAAGYAEIAAAQVTATDPVVVAHSGSGLLLPAVAEALQASRLVWLAAAVPDFAGGRGFADQLRAFGTEIAGDEWRAFGRQIAEDPLVAAYFAFHDCDLPTLRWAVTTMRLFYPEAVYAEAPPPRPGLPSTFVLPREDRTLRPEWMRQVARERLGVTPIEVDGGHFPHVSRPDQLAEILSGLLPRKVAR
ncbi:alpha/beta hydrolase [Pseudonocardiaceae bacterium YIM PH 21723]|nr:alpha/beta hydrolase [Pseudonocardiaceae bacterium YIM PH 21723]